MKIGDALQWATRLLAATSPTPRLDAEVLLAHIIGKSRTYVLTERQQSLSQTDLTAFETAIERRRQLEPVAYIIGHKEFYGLDFIVDRRVLIPRPETELLVDLALQWYAEHSTLSGTPLQIADIGTGSGCIAVSLAVYVPRAEIWAVDISRDALEVAQLNAEQHGVADRVNWLHGDGANALPHSMSLIVSNPPYTILAEVNPDVWRWEPHLALDGGQHQGFEAVARLLAQIPSKLQTPGAVLVEIGAWQGAQAKVTAHKIFSEAQISLQKDLAGHDRVLAIEI
jgi:release factor glutamine methyltransferase